MSNYDSEILQVGQGTCRILNLPRRILQLFWLDRVVWHRIESDECLFAGDGVLLPHRMKGRLEPEEWRPLMASSLIYRTIRRNLPFGIVLAGLITAALVVLGAGITADVFGNAGGKSAFLIFLVAVIAPYLANRITQARKTQRLQADHQAAILVGKEEFISVLKKIDGLGISDVKKTEERRIRQHFSSRPSVTERLSNLSLIK